VKNIQTDNRPDTGITSTGIDTATSTNRPTINQPQKIGATDATASDLKDSRDDTPQTAQTSVQPVSGAQIQAHLRRAFIPYFTYPRLAREKGWQGTVELAVKIDTQGLLTKARIIHSSGFGVLDHAALKSIRQIKVLPNTLQWLNNHGLEVNFPVKYQLIDI
jgi:protein TonB